jgi:hypothetical protein
MSDPPPSCILIVSLEPDDGLRIEISSKDNDA